jgi:hypothetical protein
MLTDKERTRAFALYAMTRSPNEHEASNAQDMLAALLRKRGVTWDEFIALVDEQTQTTQRHSDTPNILSLVDGWISMYIEMTPEERLAVALWILHCHVYDQYNITPRLALLSPVNGCGKTTLLILIKLLTPRAKRLDGVSPAALRNLLDSVPPRTILVDEGEHLGLLQDRLLRRVLNANRYDGTIAQALPGGGLREYRTFAPVAVAAVGTLPHGLMQRCVVINMQKPSPDTPLERLDEANIEFRADAAVMCNGITRWAATCQLNNNPDMPVKLRAADNWRVLIAIADDLGRGDEARRAAMTLSGGLPDENPKLLLLLDTRRVFDRLKVDRIFSKALAEALCELDDGPWNEWCGVNDDRPAHKLTQNELVRVLKDFGIRTQTVWPPGGRKTRGKSGRGYYRRDFERAWARYGRRSSHDAPNVVSLPTRKRRRR